MTALLLSSLLILFDGDRLPMPSLLPRGPEYGRRDRAGAMRNPAIRA